MRKLPLLFFLLALSVVSTIFAQDEIVWGLIDTDVADIRIRSVRRRRFFGRFVIEVQTETIVGI